MGDVKIWLAALAGIAMLTTAILPGRQTPQVLDAAGRFVSGTLGTAMGTK